MNSDSKIAVYYIATGDYKILFKDFLESLVNFYPSNKKIVKLISDGLEEYNNYEKDNVRVELCPRINHYPWPVVALYKMWIILQNYDYSCEYSCYFNANAIVYMHSSSVFNLNKITASYHSFNSKSELYSPWKYININRNSSAFLENDTYEYVQSAFFFGPNLLFKKMCEEVVELLKYDTRKSFFAQWHDESYFNKWCVLNSDLVDKKYVLTAYKNEVDENRFVFLRNKKEYFVKT